MYNDLQELKKNRREAVLSSEARERLGQVFLVERREKKSMHLLTHYAELVGDGSICSIEYILHQTLTLNPKLFSNCSYNQQQVRRITNDIRTGGNGDLRRRNRERYGWVGEEVGWGGGRAEDCKEEENP